MFIRSKTHPFGRRLSTATVRTLLTCLYVLYPLGCILQLIPETWGGGKWTSLSGLLLVTGAFIMFGVLAGSSLQRQTQEPEEMLDERERDERNRAGFTAHMLFSSIVAAGVFYLMIATDLAEVGKSDIWRPTLGAHWNAVFGAVFLLSLTLPGAVIAFGKAPPELD